MPMRFLVWSNIPPVGIIAGGHWLMSWLTKGSNVGEAGLSRSHSFRFTGFRCFSNRGGQHIVCFLST